MDPEKYWKKFLETGKAQDYVNYKLSLKLKKDTEFAQEPLESVKNDQSTKKRGNRTKNHTSS